jgi:hypothetical protein
MVGNTYFGQILAELFSLRRLVNSFWRGMASCRMLKSHGKGNPIAGAKPSVLIVFGCTTDHVYPPMKTIKLIKLVAEFIFYSVRSWVLHVFGQ